MTFPRGTAARAIAIAGALLLLAPLPRATAASIHDSAAIDVGLVEIRAKPGSMTFDRFKLINKTGADITVTSFVEDLDADAAGNIIAVARGTSVQRSAAPWIIVKPSAPKIPGNGTAQMQLDISIPKDAKPGGYYAAVTFDTDSSNPPEDRLVHSILLRVDGAGVSAQPRIASMSMPFISLTGKVGVQVAVENDGNLHAIGGGTVDVSNFGSKITTITLPTIVVLPHVQHIVTASVDSPPVAGRLTATAHFNFGTGTPLDAGASGFVLIWWLAVAVALILLLFLISVLRLVGVGGPKAAARKQRRAQEAAASAAAAPPKPEKQPKPQKQPKRRRAEPAPQPATTPPVRPAARPGATSGVAAPGKADGSFWGDEEAPAPMARIDDDVEAPLAKPRSEPAIVPAALGDARARFGLQLPGDDSGAEEDLEDAPEELDLLAGDADDADDADDANEADEAAEDDLDDYDDIEPTDDETDEAGEASDIDESDPLSGTKEPAAHEPESDVQVSWNDGGAMKPPEAPARPVPIVRPSSPSQPEGIKPAPPPLRPAEPPGIRPAGRVPRPIQVANLPPVRESEGLPAAPWATNPPEITLDKPSASGSAMSLRRAEVALRMITGKPGETGAILDAGLDLLYSVRSDGSVREHIEHTYTETRNRRRLGPLALALFAVDSRQAPQALLDAYGTASRVVAERIRKAILACDPADIRPHRTLIDALPQSRRDAIGL